MIYINHFRTFVIRPVLDHLGMYSQAAEALLLGTAVHESMLTYLKQIKGPALGVYQIEPATCNDVWDNYLTHRPGLYGLVLRFAGQSRHQDLIGNLNYQTAIARIIYYRDSEPLPDVDNLKGLAEYWKRVYNTAGGRGTAAEWIDNYRHFILKEG